jgi:hypothetical protein
MRLGRSASLASTSGTGTIDSIVARVRAGSTVVPNPGRTDIDMREDEEHPARVFDFETKLDGIAEAYAAMDERRAIKSLIRMEAKEGAGDPVDQG